MCLFSLDKHAAIPVDTHVWQLAARYYTPHLKGAPGLLLSAYLCKLVCWLWGRCRERHLAFMPVGRTTERFAGLSLA